MPHAGLAMGMRGHYRHVTGNVLTALMARPKLAETIALHQPAHPSGLPAQVREMLAALPPEQAAAVEVSFRAKFEELSGEKVGASSAQSASRLRAGGIDPDEVDEGISIDKAWHGLHVVLAGTAWEPTAPPGNAVLGGTAIGKDVGYGPIRYITAADVKVTAAALNAISDDEFRAKCSLAELAAAEAYAIDPDNPEEVDWLVDAFTKVRAYFDEASSLDRGMLLFVI